MATYATYDLLMIAVLGLLTLYGYFKGMAWQVAYISSFVASYILAVRFADRLAPQVTGFFPSIGPPINKFVAMAIIYAGASFAVWMVFRLVRGAIDRVKMDGFDRQMGALIGFARGVLWCVGITFFAVTLLPASVKQQVVHSQSGYYIARVLQKTDSVFPPEVDQVIGPYLEQLETELAPAQQWQGTTTAQPNGWPASSQQQPAQGGWGQQQPAQPSSAPGWPSSTPSQAPAAPGWPQATNQPPAQQPSNGWPATTSRQPATPAQPASWPEWPQ